MRVIYDLSATDILIKAMEQLEIDGHQISRVIIMGNDREHKIFALSQMQGHIWNVMGWPHTR